jgi:ACS family allantoate permease-like MFS transporter
MATAQSDMAREVQEPSVDAPPPELIKHVDEKIMKHSHDADAAMKAFEGYEGQVIELSEETRKRLLRKIDLHLMPVRTRFLPIHLDIPLQHTDLGRRSFA